MGETFDQYVKRNWPIGVPKDCVAKNEEDEDCLSRASDDSRCISCAAYERLSLEYDNGREVHDVL